MLLLFPPEVVGGLLLLLLLLPPDVVGGLLLLFVLLVPPAVVGGLFSLFVTAVLSLCNTTLLLPPTVESFEQLVTKQNATNASINAMIDFLITKFLSLKNN